MFIKRSAFLLLTGVLAQQACTTAKTDDPDTGGTGGTGGDGGSSASAGAGGAPDNQAGSSVGIAGNGEAGAPGGAGGTGGAGLGGAALGGESAGGVGGAAGGEGGMTSCTGDVGTPGTCSTVCTDETAELWCTSKLDALKLGVAEAAYDCLAEGTKCDDFEYECVRDALAGACPDAGLDDFCTAAVAACNPNDPIDMAGCHALVDGLNEVGLTSISSCVDEGGCQFGLWSCVESL